MSRKSVCNTRERFHCSIPLTVVDVDVFAKLLPLKVRVLSDSLEVQVIQLK